MASAAAQDRGHAVAPRVHLAKAVALPAYGAIGAAGVMLRI